MVGIDTPDGWTFATMKSNTRFNNEGHRLVYENEAVSGEVYLEYIIDWDADEDMQEAGRDYLVRGVKKLNGQVEEQELFTFGGGEEPNARAKTWAREAMLKFRN